jgi:hypothetical protein
MAMIRKTKINQDIKILSYVDLSKTLAGDPGLDHELNQFLQRYFSATDFRDRGSVEIGGTVDSISF